MDSQRGAPIPHSVLQKTTKQAKKAPERHKICQKKSTNMVDILARADVTPIKTITQPENIQILYEVQFRNNDLYLLVE